MGVDIESINPGDGKRDFLFGTFSANGFRVKLPTMPTGALLVIVI